MRSRLRTKKLCFFSWHSRAQPVSRDWQPITGKHPMDGCTISMLSCSMLSVRECALLCVDTPLIEMFTLLFRTTRTSWWHTTSFVCVCIVVDLNTPRSRTREHMNSPYEVQHGSCKTVRTAAENSPVKRAADCRHVCLSGVEWKIPQWNCLDNRAFTQRKLSQVVQIHFHRCIQWNICNTKCLNTSERCERHFITRELIKVWTISFDHGVCVRLTVRIYDVQYNMYTVRHKMRFN